MKYIVSLFVTSTHKFLPKSNAIAGNYIHAKT